MRMVPSRQSHPSRIPRRRKALSTELAFASSRPRVRVQDVDFARNQIMVRGGKGDKDRATPLPAAVIADLAQHLEVVKRQHDADLRHGAG